MGDFVMSALSFENITSHFLISPPVSSEKASVLGSYETHGGQYKIS